MKRKLLFTPGPLNSPPEMLSPVNVALVTVTPGPASSLANCKAVTPLLRSCSDQVAA